MNWTSSTTSIKAAPLVAMVLSTALLTGASNCRTTSRTETSQNQDGWCDTPATASSYCGDEEPGSDHGSWSCSSEHECIWEEEEILPEISVIELPFGQIELREPGDTLVYIQDDVEYELDTTGYGNLRDDFMEFEDKLQALQTNTHAFPIISAENRVSNALGKFALQTWSNRTVAQAFLNYLEGAPVEHLTDTDSSTFNFLLRKTFAEFENLAGDNPDALTRAMEKAIKQLETTPRITMGGLLAASTLAEPPVTKGPGPINVIEDPPWETAMSRSPNLLYAIAAEYVRVECKEETSGFLGGDDELRGVGVSQYENEQYSIFYERPFDEDDDAIDTNPPANTWPQGNLNELNLYHWAENEKPSSFYHFMMTWVEEDFGEVEEWQELFTKLESAIGKGVEAVAGRLVELAKAGAITLDLSADLITKGENQVDKNIDKVKEEAASFIVEALAHLFGDDALHRLHFYEGEIRFPTPNHSPTWQVRDIHYAISKTRYEGGFQSWQIPFTFNGLLLSENEDGDPENYELDLEFFMMKRDEQVPPPIGGPLPPPGIRGSIDPNDPNYGQYHDSNVEMTPPD